MFKPGQIAHGQIASVGVQAEAKVDVQAKVKVCQGRHIRYSNGSTRPFAKGSLNLGAEIRVGDVHRLPNSRCNVKTKTKRNKKSTNVFHRP